LFVAAASLQVHANPVSKANTFEKSQDFYHLRKQIIELLSSAKTQIILVSDFLTDGNIATALYLAKYRNLSVKVFLARPYITRYLSRYDYLKNQGVTVYIRPKSFPFKAKTILKVDNNLYEINRDLDVLKSKTSGSLKLIAKKWNGYFDQSINKAIQAKGNVNLPQRQNKPTASKQNSETKSSANQVSKDYAREPSGAYNYDNGQNKKKKAPYGIAKKLPKLPVYLKKKVADTNKSQSLKGGNNPAYNREEPSAQKKPSNWINPQSRQQSDDTQYLEEMFNDTINDQ
jgi:hypothetical protein